MPDTDKTKMNESKMIKVPEGTVVVREGEVSLDMYKIIRGHAEVYVGYGTSGETIIGIIGPQSCFGEFGLLLKKPAIYTVVAYSELYLLRVTEGDIGDFVQANHKNIIDIMRNMASMMQTMRTQMDMMLRDLEEGRKPDKQTIRDIRRSMRGYSIYDADSGRPFEPPRMHFVDKRA